MNKIIGKSLGTKLINSIGTFLIGGYEILYDNNITNHIIVYSNLEDPVPVRIQSGCLVGDIFADTRCNCHYQLLSSLNFINKHQNGLLIYTLEHDGRGKGYLQKLRVYKLKDKLNIDSKSACDLMNIEYDIRDYSPIVMILNDLGIKNVLLLSSNEKKKKALLNNNINVVNVIDFE